MIVLNKFIIIFPLLSPTVTIEPTRVNTESMPYSSYTIEQPKFKNSLEYNTMTNEDLIRENNEKIIQQIYKTLE